MKTKIEIDIKDLEINQKEQGYFSFKYKIEIHVSEAVSICNTSYYSSKHSREDTDKFKYELENWWAIDLVLWQEYIMQLYSHLD